MTPTTVSSSAYYYPGLKEAPYNQNHLIKDVCTYFKISIEDVTEKGRGGVGRKKIPDNIIKCKQVCAYFIKNIFPETGWKDVGKMVGRDHSTAIYSVRQVQNDIFSSVLYKEMINEIEQIINTNRIKKNEIN